MSSSRPGVNRAGLLAITGAVLALVIAACGGATSTAAPTSSTATTAPAAASAAATAGTVNKVSANSASQSELVAALTAAGVPNADRWTREVMEYRPYPADDPTLQHLQDNLAKYNPDPATLAAILSALEP